MTTIKAPFFEIGPKSYLYGDEILELAQAAANLGYATGAFFAQKTGFGQKYGIDPCKICPEGVFCIIGSI